MPKIYSLTNITEYKKAGKTDLIEMLPVPGNDPFIVLKEKLEALCYGIVKFNFIHISGPTGSGKSLLIESLEVPENFSALCQVYGYPNKPLKIHSIEMVQFEISSELYFRRSIRNGNTYDEESPIVEALREASCSKDMYHVIWLREIGRTHSASVQSGLLNLMTKRSIHLRGNVISAPNVCWIADSNYMSNEDATFNLVLFDDALKRRFHLNISLEYLTAEQEISVLRQILEKDSELEGKVDYDLILKVVDLGNTIRRFKAEGKLQSVVAPTIYIYLAFIRMASTLKSWTPQEIAKVTLLGNATSEDAKLIPSVFAETRSFSIYVPDEEKEIAGVQF